MIEGIIRRLDVSLHVHTRRMKSVCCFVASLFKQEQETSFPIADWIPGFLDSIRYLFTLFHSLVQTTDINKASTAVNTPPPPYQHTDAKGIQTRFTIQSPRHHRLLPLETHPLAPGPRSTFD